MTALDQITERLAAVVKTYRDKADYATNHEEKLAYTLVGLALAEIGNVIHEVSISASTKS